MVQDEYGSARNSNITLNRINENLNAILAKKLELNTFPDTSKKKKQIAKDSILYATPKNKSIVDSWFRDLASSNGSLQTLSRKVPYFQQKEKIFSTLCEFNVPMFRAIWYVKMFCAHHIAASESSIKTRKRQVLDPSQEWTTALCKFVKEHFNKIQESVSGNTTSITNPLHMNAPQQVSTEDLLKQWNYYVELCRNLYEEQLLERMDYLLWALEIFEKIKSIDDPGLGLILSMLLQYIDEFVQSEELSRRLAFFCCEKIHQIVFEFNFELNSQEVNNNMIMQNGTVNMNAQAHCFKKITECSKLMLFLTLHP